MADRVFSVRRKLRESPAERTVEKNRVVPEAAFPPFFLGDDSPDLSAARLEDPASLGKDELADESRPALRPGHALQEPQDLADVFLVGGPGIGKAGRKNPRSAAEGVDVEAGVLGQGQVVAQKTVGQALLPGVLEEGLPLLFDLARSPDIAEGQELDGKASERPPNLPHLARVKGRKDDLFPTRS